MSICSGVGAACTIPDWRWTWARRFQTHLSGKGAKFTRAYPPEEIAAVWRCGDKGTAARVEYAIKKRLTHQQKEQLAAAPGHAGGAAAEVGEWGVSAKK